jgi:carbon monoxide dehydrogenase subunit G
MTSVSRRFAALFFAFLMVTTPVAGAVEAGTLAGGPGETETTAGTAVAPEDRPTTDDRSTSSLVGGSITDPGTGIEVSFPGSNVSRSNVSIESYPRNRSHALPSEGPVVRIGADASFDTATVSMPIPDSVNDSQLESLSIYRWTGTGANGWQPLSTQRDSQDSKLTTTVSTLGFFAVMNRTTWNESTRIQRPETIAPEDPAGVYVGTANGTLRKLPTEGGEPVWTRSDATGPIQVATDPEGAVYVAENRTGALRQYDWVDGSITQRGGFESGVVALTSARDGLALAAADAPRGGNITVFDGDSGYRPWTVSYYSEQGPDYNVDDVTQGPDAVYAALYFEGRRSGARLVRITEQNVTAPGDEVDPAWNRTIDAIEVEDIKRGSNGGLYVATASGVRRHDAETGTQQWQTSLDGGASELAVSDGTLFAIEVGSEGSVPELVRIDATTGSTETATTLPVDEQTTITELAVGTNGTVYVGSRTGSIFAPNATSQRTAGAATAGVQSADATDTDAITIERGETESLDSSSPSSKPATDDATETSISGELATASPTVQSASTSSSGDLSISAEDTSITTEDELALSFQADSWKTVTLGIETPSGQSLYSRQITAAPYPRTFRLSNLPTGEYVGVLSAGGTEATTQTITVSEPGENGPTQVSIDALQTDLTNGDDLTVEYVADGSAEATLSVLTTSGQSLMEQSVQVGTQPAQYTVSDLPTGKYEVRIETAGGLSDTTATVSVTEETTGPTQVSIEAQTTDLTKGDDLTVEYSADASANATVSVLSSSGQSLMEQSVQVGTQPAQFTIQDLPTGEYEVQIETAGGLTDSTATVSVTEDTSAPTQVSIQAQETELTKGDDLTVEYTADASANATLSVLSSSGQSLMEQPVDVGPTPTEFTVSNLPTGEFEVTIETEGGLTDSTAPITVSESDSGGPTQVSIQAQETEIAKGEKLTVEYSADARTNATLSVLSSSGQSLMDRSVEVRTTPTEFTVSNLPTGEFEVTIETEGGLTDSTAAITVSEDDGDGGSGLSIAALSNRITTAENLTVEFSADSRTDATLTVQTTAGQTVLESSVTARSQPRRLTIPNLSRSHRVRVSVCLDAV